MEEKDSDLKWQNGDINNILNGWMPIYYNKEIQKGDYK